MSLLSSTNNPGFSIQTDEFTQAEEDFLIQFASLGDPGADRIVFWDESANALAYLEAGSGLTITGTTITADGGSVPTTITVADTTDATAFVALFESATGDLGPKTDGGITYNATTGTLTVTAIASALTGNVTGDVSGNAGTVTFADEATDTTCFIAFATAASGSLAPKTNANMTFNSNTGVVTFASSVLTTTDINGGTIDATTIGASTPSTGVFTTLVAGSTTSLLLGTAGSAVGNIGFRNATSGTITLAPVTGALGTVTLTLPAITDTIVTLTATQTLTNKTLTSPTLTTPSAFTTGGTITLAENTSIALDPAGSADGKYTGITISGTAGAALAFGDLVYLASADSRWELADADAATTADRMLGMCVLAAASDGDPTVLLLMGQIRADAAFPALTIGSAVYVGETAGDIQVAIPTGADNVIRRVGYALTADEIYFNPSMDSQITVA
jgi:hypothetical protein